MTCSEIAELIKVCSLNGVVEFTKGDLKILFSKVDNFVLREPVQVPEEVQVRADATSEESALKEQVQYRQDELELMLLEDPARYEELLRSGDIK